MKRAKHIVLWDIILLLAGTLIGFLALVLVYCLPTYPMKFHVGQSLPIIEREFGDSELIPGNAATLTGNFTDCLMMEHAIYETEEHSFLEQLLIMYRGESGIGDGWAPGYSLVDYVEDIAQPREADYARYWHGYLVILKPLLLLTTFNTIRVMAGVGQFVLAGVVLLLCGRRRKELLGAAFLLSVPCLYLFTMYASLSLSICYYIMTGAMIVALLFHDRLVKKERYFAFFLIVGMLTSYFDFLTYPIVTLGYPLCVYLYLSADNAKESFKRLVGYSAQWSVGYLGFWAMKWVLADLLVGGNTIRDALENLFIRTESAEGYSKLAGFFKVVGQCVEPYTNWGFYFLALGIILFFGALLFKNRSRINAQRVRVSGVLLLVALFPFVWLFLTQNHAEQHWLFVFKILAVSVFAACCAAGKLIEKGGAADA